MGKSAILMLSVLQFLVGFFLSVFVFMGSLFGPELFGEFVIVLIIVIFLLLIVASFSLWLALIVVVAKDATKRGKSGAYGLLPFLLGSIGGLIYCLMISSEKD